MTVIWADSTVSSYMKALACEKLSKEAENLKGGTIPSLMRTNLQELMPEISSDFLNHCLRLFKDALQTDYVDKMNIEKVELGIDQLDNPLKILNNRNRSYAYAFLIQIPELFTSVCVQVRFGES